MIPEPVMTVAELTALLGPTPPGEGGMQIEAVTPAGVDLRYVVTDRHVRPGGTVSGPTMMTLVDAVAWFAIMSRIGPVVLAVTTSLHIDFLRKPAVEDLIGRGEIVKLGKRLGVVGVRVSSASSDQLVALSQVTYSIPPQR